MTRGRVFSLTTRVRILMFSFINGCTASQRERLEPLIFEWIRSLASESTTDPVRMAVSLEHINLLALSLGDDEDSIVSSDDDEEWSDDDEESCEESEDGGF